MELSKMPFADLRFNKVLMYREMLVGIATDCLLRIKWKINSGLKSKKEIDKFGIGKYNSECKNGFYLCR